MSGIFWRKSAAARAESTLLRNENITERLREAERSLEWLQTAYHRLLVEHRALGKLIRERLSVAPEHWDQLMEQAQDEQEEAILSSNRNCARCGKVLSHRHDRCMYCGAPRPPPATDPRQEKAP